MEPQELLSKAQKARQTGKQVLGVDRDVHRGAPLGFLPTGQGSLSPLAFGFTPSRSPLPLEPCPSAPHLPHPDAMADRCMCKTMQCDFNPIDRVPPHEFLWWYAA